MKGLKIVQRPLIWMDATKDIGLLVSYAFIDLKSLVVNEIIASIQSDRVHRSVAPLTVIRTLDTKTILNREKNL